MLFAHPSFARWQHRRETSTPIVTAVRSRRRTVQLSSRHRHKVEVCAPLPYSTGGEANNSSNELLELGWGGQRSEGELTITRPNFGGSRPWFRCRGCRKQVALHPRGRALVLSELRRSSLRQPTTALAPPVPPSVPNAFGLTSADTPTPRDGSVWRPTSLSHRSARR